MGQHGKQRQDVARRFDRERLYTPAEAVELVKSLASARFDETVELAVRLGVDPRRADQIVRARIDPVRATEAS
jgi:large subunit ribosomal protein L1